MIVSRKGLAVGAKTIWITRLFITLTFVMAYPISKVLDWMLDDEVVFYNRQRLIELIKLSTLHAGADEPLADDLRIAVGAMEIADKTVRDIMTKIDVNNIYQCTNNN